MKENLHEEKIKERKNKGGGEEGRRGGEEGGKTSTWFLEDR